MQVEKRWVIKLEDGNRFISVDSYSGGYPYVTDFWGAEKFRDLTSAQKYASMGFDNLDVRGEWKIYEITDLICSLVHVETDPYEIELAALKQKHGRK